MYRSEINGKGGIYAKVVTDSIANNIRLTTLELQYPRFIHSEFMTHRLFSRNASSSRAIPFEKSIQNTKAMPIHLGKNKAGMQASVEEVPFESFKPAWNQGKLWAQSTADYLYKLGLHKQIVNRVLEPYQFIKVVVTATEWDNFFKLRLHPDAQPEIQELAAVMKEAMEKSEPSWKNWHLPYIQIQDLKSDWFGGLDDIDLLIKASVARCARVSYMNHDNSSPIIEKDIKLYTQLLVSGHMSPFEHVATPMRGWQIKVYEEHNPDPGHHDIYPFNWLDGTTHMDKNGECWSGNFKGWLQYRQILESKK